VSQDYVRSHGFVMTEPMSGDRALGQPTVLPVLDIRTPPPQHVGSVHEEFAATYTSDL